jgi:hypothetical protein
MRRRAPRSDRSLSALPGDSAGDVESSGGRPLPSQASARVSDARLCFKDIFRPTPKEGFAVGIIGDTGTGKTFALGRLIAEYVRRVPFYAWICDVKRESGFPGLPSWPCVEALSSRPPRQGQRACVIKGWPEQAIQPDPERVAQWAWWRHYARGVGGLVVADEIRDLLGGAGHWRRGGARWFEKLYTEGRSARLSVVWGTQEVQDAPRSCFNQSDELWCFRVVGLGLDRLGERGYLSGGVESVIASLPGRRAPRNHRGLFVRLIRGEPWDGKTYRFSRP